MIHSGLGGGSSTPATNTASSWWNNWIQQSAYGTTLWNPTTSYSSVDQWRQQTGGTTLPIQLGTGGFPEGFDQWRVGLDRPTYTAPPAAAPVKASNDWEGMAWLFLGLI